MFTTYRVPPMLATGTTVRPSTWVATTLRRLLGRFGSLRHVRRAHAPAA